MRPNHSPVSIKEDPTMLEHSKLLHDSWLRWAAESKEDADICIMGVPFDGAVSLNAGAAQAPETLRMLSIDLSDLPPSQHHDIMITPSLCKIHLKSPRVAIQSRI